MRRGKEETDKLETDNHKLPPCFPDAGLKRTLHVLRKVYSERITSTRRERKEGALLKTCLDTRRDPESLMGKWRKPACRGDVFCGKDRRNESKEFRQSKRNGV